MCLTYTTSVKSHIQWLPLNKTSQFPVESNLPIKRNLYFSLKRVLIQVVNNIISQSVILAALLAFNTVKDSGSQFVEEKVVSKTLCLSRWLSKYLNNY